MYLFYNKYYVLSNLKNLIYYVNFLYFIILTPCCYFRGSAFKPDKYETRNCYPTQSKEVLEAIDKKLNELILCK